MSARDAILGRIRQRRPDVTYPAGIEQEAAGLVPDVARVRPSFGEQSSLDRFVEKATSPNLAASVVRLGALAEVPRAVRVYLDAQGLPPHLCLGTDEMWEGLDWQGLGLHHDIARNEPAALTRADGAIAETGTLVFRSSPSEPTLFNFLALHHLVVLMAADLHSYMEDFWAGSAGRPAPQPRSLNFVTGVSGTADIEGQHVKGAHGPRFLHILLVGSQAR